MHMLCGFGCKLPVCHCMLIVSLCHERVTFVGRCVGRVPHWFVFHDDEGNLQNSSQYVWYGMYNKAEG